jgi:hypothetical protein
VSGLFSQPDLTVGAIKTPAEIYNLAVRTCTVVPLTALTDAEALAFDNGATVNLEQLQQNMGSALGAFNKLSTQSVVL